MTTININLLPEELRLESGSGGGGDWEMSTVVPIAIGAVVAIALGLAPMLITSMYLDPRDADLTRRDDELTQEIAKYNTTLNSLKAIADNKEQLRAQLATLQNVASGGGPGLADMLNELRAITPANLWFENLQTDNAKGTIQLQGAALDYSSVAFFQRNLQHSDFFTDPVLGQTQMNEGAEKDGPSVVKFTMEISLKKKS